MKLDVKYITIIKTIEKSPTLLLQYMKKRKFDIVSKSFCILGAPIFSSSKENKRTPVSNNSCKEFCQLVLAEYRIIGGENIIDMYKMWNNLLLINCSFSLIAVCKLNAQFFPFSAIDSPYLFFFQWQWLLLFLDIIGYRNKFMSP